MTIIASAPFQPVGITSSTTNIDVTATSQVLNLVPPSNQGGSLILTNIGVKTIFFCYGNNTASITTSMPILANTANTVALPPGVTQISAIAASPGSTLYATVGDGL